MKFIDKFEPKNKAEIISGISFDQTKNLVIFSFCISFILINYAFLYAFMFNSIFIASWCIGCSLFCFLIPFIYKRSGKFNLCSHLIVLNGAIIIFIATLYTGGIGSYSIFWSIAIPMVAGYLLGLQATFIWGLLTIALIVSIFIFEYFFGQLPSEVPKNKIIFVYVSAIFGIVGMISFFTYLFQLTIANVIGKLIERTQELNQILRVLSHDINNPLSIIILSTNNIKPHEQITYDKAVKIQRAATIISNILTNLREIQAISSGKIKLELSSVNLREALDDSLFVLQEPIKKKNINLEVEFSDTLIKVLAERMSLSNQVLSNVISNAIKFSPIQGIITINVKSEEDQIIVTVSDKGIGIPPSLLNKIFDPTTPTTRKGTSGEHGSGFGLPIVKSYVEKFGGHVSINSRSLEEFPNNHGTEVIIRFIKYQNQMSA